MRRLLSGIALALLLPLFAAAQEDALRSEIRSDLGKDPRSADMTDAELTALTDALAEEAEAQGSAEAYLTSKGTFDYSSLFPPVEGDISSLMIITSPIVIAILCLLAALLTVVLYVMRRRRTRLAAANLQKTP